MKQVIKAERVSNYLRDRNGDVDRTDFFGSILEGADRTPGIPAELSFRKLYTNAE
jgi:hypothetical protein